MKETSPNRVIYFDLLRIAATFAVVVLHISASRFSKLDYASFQWNVQNVYNGISRWGVGIFVMISGALFLKEDIPLKKLYRKYILRIALSFIFWSFLYSLLFNLIPGSSVKDFLKGIVKGHNHLWFLYMIAGMYMIVPFLRKIIVDEKLTRYFLMIGLIFAFIIPQAISIIRVFSEEYGTLAQTVVDNMHLHFVLGFSVYFVLGYYLSQETIPPKLERTILILGMFGLVTTVLGNAVMADHFKNPTEFFYANNTVNVLLEVVGVFILFKKLFGNVHLSESMERKICALSKYSFGAYLIHPAVKRYLDKTIHMSAAAFNPIFSIPLTALVVFIISYALSAILNRIPVVKKYLV